MSLMGREYTWTLPTIAYPKARPAMTLTGQDDPLLRRASLRGPRALVSQDPAGGGGRPDGRRRHRREDLPGEARLPAHRGHQRGRDRGRGLRRARHPGGYAPDIMRRSPSCSSSPGRSTTRASRSPSSATRAGCRSRPASSRGKRGTSVGAIKDDLVNAGMLWEDSPVVVDGNLISSRTPADLPQFMRALIAALKGQRSERGTATCRRARRLTAHPHVPLRGPTPGGRLDQPVRGGLLPPAHQHGPPDRGGGGAGPRGQPPVRPEDQEERASPRATWPWRWRTSSSC